MNTKITVSFKNILLFCSVFFSMFFYTIQGSTLFHDSMKILLAVSILFSLGFAGYSFIGNLKKGYVKFGICYAVIAVIMLYLFFTSGSDTRKMFFPMAVLVGFFAQEEKLIEILFYCKLLPYCLVFLFGEYWHINGLALHGGMLLALYFCYSYEKMDIKRFAFMLAVFLIIVLKTDSGSVKIGIGFLMLLYLMSKVKFFNKIIMSRAMSFAFAIAFGINILMCLSYGERRIPVIGTYLPDSVNNFVTGAAKVLNKYTTGRMTLGKFSLKTFGVSLFGGNINYNKLDKDYYFNLDSGMLWLLQGWGIILTVLVIALFTFMLWQLIKYKKTQYVLATIVIICWGINEEMLFSIGTNFMIYFIGVAFRYAFDENIKLKMWYSQFICT